MNEPENKSLAVLIDADNASANIIAVLLAEIAKYGTASVKRIYGDWTKPNLGPWKDVLLEHSIQPIQQFRYTTGKNATDCAMIIDAMDLLFTDRFAGFCLVSSDSDFTRLAARIRESGIFVLGFGEKKTPRPFVTACDKFIYTEVLKLEEKGGEQKKWSSHQLQKDQELVKLFRDAILSASDESGWANLSAVGSNISKNAPDFDQRNYGYTKLGDLAENISMFELKKFDNKILIKDRNYAA